MFFHFIREIKYTIRLFSERNVMTKEELALEVIDRLKKEYPLHLFLMKLSANIPALLSSVSAREAFLSSFFYSLIPKQAVYTG